MKIQSNIFLTFSRKKRVYHGIRRKEKMIRKIRLFFHILFYFSSSSDYKFDEILLFQM